MSQPGSSNGPDTSQPQNGVFSDASASLPSTSTMLGRAQRWVSRHLNSTLADERTPLVNRARGTLEIPKMTLRKIIITVITIIVALVVLGFLMAYWLMDPTHEAPPNEKLNPVDVVIEVPSTASLLSFLETYASTTHLAGTDADSQQAEWTRDQWIGYGITNTTIETYHPLLNYPVQRRVALVTGPEHLRYEASLTEDDIPQENGVNTTTTIVPTYHGYSKNGSAFGPVVYANYGRLEDFQFLLDNGIPLNGTIALVRSGRTGRGFKLQIAEAVGCIGVLIYSDPIDDGPVGKDTDGHPYPARPYPEGPWRSEDSVERGSVQYASLFAGDPLTPGYAATKDAPRIAREAVEGLPNIPSLPLSYRDALPLLKATEGRGVFGQGDWIGGSDAVGYYSGPTEGDVDLLNIVEDKTTPIWNVIGRIEGKEEPDRVIVLGNHRDAWVYGAADPSSGSAVMMELVRALGVLLQKGWQPRRTLILASWDAAEFGYVGSTEWVEDHRDWLGQSVAAYINVDTGVSGPHFTAHASPSLKRLLYDVTQQVTDPDTQSSVYTAWRDRTSKPGHPSPFVGPLGSGSDFVAFLNHIGIASIDMAFHGDYGVHHSTHDSLHWMSLYGDPTLAYHQALTRIWGLLALRLSSDRILPIYPGDYSQELLDRVEDLSTGTTSSFSMLRKALRKLTKTTRRFERRRARLEARLEQDFADVDDEDLPQVVIKRMTKANKRLTFFERGFIDPEGLPRRPWFRHVIYGPNHQTGDGSVVFPGILDAIESGEPDLILEAEERTAKRVMAAKSWLKVD